MKNLFKNHVFWGVVIGVIIIALIWGKVSTQLSNNRSSVSTSTASELVLNNNVATTSVKTVQTAVADPLVTFLRNSEKSAGINYPVVAQVVYYNIGGKTFSLKGYGYSFTEHSSSTQSTVLAKIKGYFSNMTIDLMNTGAPGSGVTSYNSDKYVCILFEKLSTSDVHGDKEVSVKCASRPVTKK